MRRWWGKLVNRLRWGRIAVLALRPGDIVLVYVPGAVPEHLKHTLQQTFASRIARAGHRDVEVLVMDDTVSVNILRKGLGF